MKKPIHFIAGFRTTWKSLAIYAAIMCGFALMMIWYYPTVGDTLSDPVAEGEGILLTEMGDDSYNLTWDVRIGAAYHIAMGGSDMDTYSMMAAYIQDPDADYGPYINTSAINAMVQEMLTNETSMEQSGVQLLYTGQGTQVEFERAPNSTYFWVVFMASETNMTPVNITPFVSTTDLIVSSDFDEYLEDNVMVEAFFGIDSFDFTTIEGWISLEFFSMWPLFFVIFVVIKASGMVSKHVEDKSMDIFLATGYSRERFLAEGTLLQGLNMLAVAVLALLGLVVGCLVINEPIPMMGFVMAFVGSLPMTIGFLGIAILISVLIDEGMKAIGAVMGVVIGSYIMQIIANLSPDYVGDVLGYACLFKYYDAYGLLTDYNMAVENWIVPTVVGVVALVVAFVVFRRKEIHA